MMMTFFRDFTLYLTEQLANLHLKLAIQGIEVKDMSYGALMERLPDAAHIGVLQGAQTLCALYTEESLVSLATERLLGSPLESAGSTSYPLSFSETFFFKLWCEWTITFFEQRKISLTLQRSEHFIRDLHLCFQDDIVTCVTISLKLNQTISTSVCLILPQKELVDE